MPRRSPQAIRRLDGSKFAVLLVLAVLAIILFVIYSWQQQLQTPVRVPQQTNVQLSSQQLHQLVRSGRQTLNSNK